MEQRLSSCFPNPSHKEEADKPLDQPTYSQDVMDKRSLALTYFDRALALDSNNIIAATFSSQVCILTVGDLWRSGNLHDLICIAPK
jgi:hypothetical protein